MVQRKLVPPTQTLFFSVLLSIKQTQAFGLKVFTDSSHVKFELTSDDKQRMEGVYIFLSVVHPYPPMTHLTWI
jgi:hypothetical protein